MGTALGLGLCVVLFFGSFALVIFLINRGNDELADARNAYQGALAELKTSPANPTLRQTALEAGRRYASVTRENRGATVFDEVALKNDLDAVTAGAVAAPSAPAPVASVADRLRQLDDLRQQGLVTDDEYRARRAKILEGV
jgi:hypothetical protein